MTASEQLYALTVAAFAHFAAMSPAALAFNAGLTGAVAAGFVVAAWGWGRAIRWAARKLPGAVTADRRVRTTRVVRLADTVLRLFAIAAALVLIARLWGLDLYSWISAGVGEQFVSAGLRLGLLAIGAAISLEIAGFVIGRGIARIASSSEDARRQAQLNTLGPLLRGVARTAIVLVFALMALGEIGVQIGPLLAGAGVVGIALGFGAQTLVKDFLTGVFLVVEDIVSVGDVVRIGDSGGMVEQMTLRTIRLRDFDGTLHVFPYGEAQVVHNLTKTFSYYVFDLQVSYGSDIDRALSVMNAVGRRLQADAAFTDKILEPIEVVGVDSLGDSGVVLKARIKTVPVQQWAVGREYNRRIKLAFDREGIEIPFPHMQVVLPEPVAEPVKH